MGERRKSDDGSRKERTFPFSHARREDDDDLTVGMDGEMGPSEGIHRTHMYARRAKLKLRPVNALEEEEEEEERMRSVR